MNIKQLFKDHNLKYTNQRSLVLNAVIELGDNATLKNIVNKCNNKVDNSTIYRIIELLIKNNIFDKQINYNNEIYYVLKEEHGHYFTCIECHNKEKIDECPLELVEHNLEENKGYKILNHTVKIEGICNKCQRKSHM